MKKHSIMKYKMMVVVALLCVTTMYAQSDVPFRSTSSMEMSNSRYQSAAVTGTSTTDDWQPANAPGARRSVMNTDPFGGETTGGTENPNEPGENQDPLGDAVPFLLLLAAGYAFIRFRKAKSI